MMYFRAGALTILLALGAVPGSAASMFWEAAQKLDGHWENDIFTLRVDSARAQASIDPKKPFQWQRFIVKAVSGDAVVFTVGPELFEATLRDDELVLTSSSFRGERVLQRPRPLLGLRR